METIGFMEIGGPHGVEYVPTHKHKAVQTVLRCSHTCQTPVNWKHLSAVVKQLTETYTVGKRKPSIVVHPAADGASIIVDVYRD